jgi:hypothetical protein
VLRVACVAIIPLAVLVSCVSARADDSAFGTLVTDPEKIIGLMRGNTFQGVLQETGEPWVEFYCDSGRSLYDFEERISLGKWWLDKGEVCFAYDWSKYEHVNCFQMYTKTDGSLTFAGTDTDEGLTLTFHSAPPTPGDPFHLEKRAATGCQLEPSV